MLGHYVRFAWRTLRKQGIGSATKASSLTLGLTGCLLIALFVRHELRFDRFHENADRIYRIIAETAHGPEAVVPPTLGPGLDGTLPEIQHVVRIRKIDDVLVGSVPLDHASRSLQIYENDFLFVDSSFFDVFGFRLIEGDPDQVLAKPFSVILTKEMAEKYFPGASPIGQSIRFEGDHEFEVTGVIETAPTTSSIRFNFIASFSSLLFMESEAGMLSLGWRVAAYPTYVLLRDSEHSSAIARHLDEFVASRTDLEFVLAKRHRLEPLTDVHLFSGANDFVASTADARYLYIFSVTAALILLIGAINFINLSTAEADRRLKEIGIRKTVGARPRQLVFQFLCESILLSFLALLGAVLLLEFLTPLFSDLIQRDVRVRYLGDASFWMFAAALSLCTGILAGIYPAVHLARQRPGVALMNRVSGTGRGLNIRQLLVVSQYTISVVFIIGVLVVEQQMDFLRNRNPGFDEERVVVLPLKDESIQRNAEVLSREIQRLGAVVDVTFSSSVPTRPHMKVRWESEESGSLAIGSVGVDENFLDTYGIQLLEGRAFSTDHSDASHHTRVGGAVVNESVVRQLGLTEPIGEEIPVRPHGHRYRVVGVVSDFQVASSRDEIGPLILTPIEDSRTEYLSVKLAPSDLAGSMESIEQTWKNVAPDLPFDFFFVDRAFDQMYRAEDRFAMIFRAFVLMAVFISCLGLVGLASFSTSCRTKEIGIRKVLGASVRSIYTLLAGQFLGMVFVSICLAIPLAHIATDRWLSNFAYSVVPGPSTYTVAAVCGVLIALLTVSYQIIRVARMNPIEYIHSE